MDKTVLKAIIHSILAVFFVLIGPPFRMSLFAVILYYLSMGVNAWRAGVNIANLFCVN